MTDETKRRMAMLSPHATSILPRRVARASYELRYHGDQTRQTVKPMLPFRPTHLVTYVEKPGIFLIEQIIIGTETFLMTSLDAYHYSVKAMESIYMQFLESHGLLGKTFEEVDAYCDEREISPPGLVQIDLPTLSPAQFMDVVIKKISSDYEAIVSFGGLVSQ